MKKTLLLAALFSFCFSAKSQSKYIPEEKDWFFLDIAHGTWLNGPTGFENNWRSNCWSLSAMDDILFGESNFSFAYGLGYTSDNFYNNLRIAADPANGDGIFDIIPDTTDFKSNKLNIKYFEIPLELRFRGAPNEKGKFFRFYVGVRPGIRFSSYTKYKTDDFQVRYFHPNELNRFKVGTYTRIGFGNISLFAHYNVLPIFDGGAVGTTPNEENLDEIRALKIGLSLSF